MDETLAYDFFKKLQKDQFTFVYNGKFSNDVIETVQNLGEKKVIGYGGASKLKNKISFLVAECFKNVILHSDKPVIFNSTNNKPPMFMIRKSGESFSLTSVNLVDNDKVDALKNKLQEINSLNAEELRSMDVFSFAPFLGKKKSGSGLLEMAKRLGEKIKFDFEYINYYFSLFYLQLQLDADKKSKSPNFSIRSEQELYKMMLNNNLLLLYKGDFSQATILPLVEMIENNLTKRSEVVGKRKKIFYLLLELLQNISKHARMKEGLREGIFMIGIKNNKYLIYTANFVGKANEEHLKSQINYFNKLDKNALSELYKTNLLAERKENEKGSGLGLIDVARYSGNKLVYDFKHIDHSTMFFSLHVSI